MEQKEESSVVNDVSAVAELGHKTVWQADLLGFLLYPAVAHELGLQPGAYNIPFGALEAEPLPAPPGMVNRANDDWTSWELVEDHRQDRLFYMVRAATEDEPAVFAEYIIGKQVVVDGQEQRYDGGGPIPAWLLIQPPEAGGVQTPLLE